MTNDDFDAIARWLGAEVAADPAPDPLAPLLVYRQEEVLAEVLSEFYGGTPDSKRQEASDLLFFLNENGYQIAQGTIERD